MKYSARTAYTPRELKTREDWNEWQANVFGAAILLPQKEVDLAMRRFSIAVPSSKPQLKKSS